MGVILNSHVPLNLTDRVHTKTVFFLFFFCTRADCGEERWWETVFCSRSKVMQCNSAIGTFAAGANTPPRCFIYRCCWTCQTKAAVTDVQNKTLNARIRENLTQWHWGRKTRRLFPLQYFVLHCQCFTQNPTPNADTVTTLMRQKADRGKNSDNQIFYSCSPGDESIWLWWSDFSLRQREGDIFEVLI